MSSLRDAGSADEERRVPVTFRCPPELKRYIAEAAKAPHRNKTEVITSALELERALDQELGAESKAISQFAQDNGLRMGKDLAVILARLVKLGLEYERERRESPKGKTK